MTPELDNFLMHRRQWLEQATDVIQKNDPMLSREQAIRVAVIAIRSWQDLRETIGHQEAYDFILSL